MQKNNFIWLGTVVNTHALKGEVKVLSNTDSIENDFQKGNEIFYKENNSFKPLTIKSFRKQNNFILISFEGKEDINKIEFLKTHKIYIERDEEKKYYSDLVNYNVYDVEEKLLSNVIEIFDQGPYMSLVIEIDNKKTNIPLIEKFVNINWEENKINLLVDKNFFKVE